MKTPVAALAAAAVLAAPATAAAPMSRQILVLQAQVGNLNQEVALLSRRDDGLTQQLDTLEQHYAQLCQLVLDYGIGALRPPPCT